MQPVPQAKFPVGHRHQGTVPTMTIYEEQTASRCCGNTSTNIVENRQERGGRQPHRSRSPGVFVRLGVRQRRQEPRVALLPDCGDDSLRHGFCHYQIGAEGKMGSMLLDSAQGQHDDRISSELLPHLRAAEFVESVHRCHEANLANG